MAAPVTFASALSFYGIAKETTPGTPVAMTATIPLDKFEPEDKPTMLADQASRGSMAEDYDNLLGVEQSALAFGGPVYADSIGYLLAGLLGDLTTTGTAAPFTHAIALGNTVATSQPTSYTFTDFSGLGTNKARQWPGQQIEELAFKFSADGLFTFEGKSQGWGSAAAAATPTQNATTVETVPSWKLKVGLGGPAAGGTLAANVTDGELTITRTLEVIHTANNTQQPFIVRCGKVKTTGKLSLIAADETELTRLLTNAQPQLQLILDSGLTGANSAIVQFDVQKAAYQTSKINRGKEAVAFDVDFKAIANTTNAGTSGGLSPVKVTLTNAVTSNTYA